MALRDLYNDPASFKYNSKNNKFSKDIRGGGYSGQPWQKVAAPATIDQLNSLTTEALSLDYPLRGGSYEELAARQDFARIDAFLLNYPQGKAFLDKQKGLMFSNPLIESGRSLGDVNTRQYSDGRNLMTQIAEGGTGFHHPNAGDTLDDLSFIERKYEYIVSSKPTQQNRLFQLLNYKIKEIGDFLPFAGDAAQMGINTVNQGELFFYPGGPGSLYGLGQTIIRRAQDSKGNPIITSNAPMFVGSNYKDGLYSKQVQARPIVSIDYETLLGASKIYGLKIAKIGITGADTNFLKTTAQQETADYIRANKNPTSDITLFSSTMGYNKILGRKQQKPGSLLIRDFRNDVIDPNTVSRRRYEGLNVNKTTRIGIGNPGARLPNERINPDTPFVPGQDLVNMSYIEPKNSFEGNNRDIIKFGFETISNDATNSTKSTHFRAFLTGYSDNHLADWQGKRYAGRGENFYTYQGFDRQVSFTFQVAAQSKQEMKPLYNKLNYLLSTLYPDYTSDGFMRGNITKLTIGDLFYRTPGILTSLNLTVNDNTPWEIAFKEGTSGNTDSEMLETPQIITVAVTFIPILSVLPRTGLTVNNLNQTPILLASEAQKSTTFLNNNTQRFNNVDGFTDIDASLNLGNTT